MDLKSLKTFHRIVALGSFNRAAEELNYAQSTVTMQIQKLEAELGITLIERGRTFQLTEAGRLFHEQSTGIVKEMERLQGRMSDWMLGETGELRLGAVEPLASAMLPRLLQEFLTAYPKIGIAVEIGSTPLLGERLLRGSSTLRCAPGRSSAKDCILSRFSPKSSSSCSLKGIRSLCWSASPSGTSAITASCLRRRTAPTGIKWRCWSGKLAAAR